MKLTYIAQMILSVILVVLGNILTEVFDFWIFRSIAYAVCGLLFIMRPIVPKHLVGINKAVFWTWIAGVILIGILTRVYF